MVDVLAYIAGGILMISYLPQLLKTLRYKKVDDLSLLMLLATLVSSLLYEAYACLLDLIPVIIMNGLFTVSVFIQLLLKLKYNKRKIV